MSTNAPFPPNAEDVWTRIREAYPDRDGGQGWADAHRRYLGHLRAGVDPVAMLTGVRDYAEHCRRANKTGTEHVKQAMTFFGPGRWWEERYMPIVSPGLRTMKPTIAREQFADIMRANMARNRRRG